MEILEESFLGGNLKLIMKRFTWLKAATGVAMLAAALLSPQARAAGLVFAIMPSPVNIGVGGSSAFDVTLTNTSASSIGVGGFSFGITTSDSNVLFTSANMSTSSTYIFPAADSADVQFFGTTIVSTQTGTTMIGSDFTANGDNITLTSGETVGLAHVFVSDGLADSIGSVAIQFLVNAPNADTSLATGSGAAITDFTTANGTLLITPEPGTWLLLAPIMLSLLWQRRRAVH